MRLVLPVGVALLAVLAAGCGDNPAPDDDPAPDLPTRVVVFSPDALADSESGPEADWTPSAEDVIAAEKLLDERLRSSTPEEGLEGLTDYVRQ